MMSELLAKLLVMCMGLFGGCALFLLTVGGYVMNIVCLVDALKAEHWGLAILHGIGIFPAPPLGMLLGDLAIFGII